MKKFKLFFFIASALLVMNTASYAQHDEEHKSEEPVGKQVEGGVIYGSEIKMGTEVITFEDLMRKSDEYNGKDVVVAGTVADVCQKMGCWLTMASDKGSVRVTTLHDFFVPKGSAGKDALIQGKFKVTEISEEKARHYNDESKTTTIKTEDIKGPQKVYEIEASGVQYMGK